jgi:hypothetical protein
MGGLDDLVERCRGPRVPSASKLANRGRGQGPLQHPWVQSGRSRLKKWWCRGRPMVVAWAGDAVQQGNGQIGKFP